MIESQTLVISHPASNSGVWLHVDINAYFATLVQQEIPSLRGKPIAIVKEAGRTCVIAASKEAKKAGIKTGFSVAQAQSLIPNLLVIPAAFPQYQSATKRLYRLLVNLSPAVELFSLDEAFLPFDNLRSMYPSVIVFAQLLQTQIKLELGEWVTCNVGIGPNRLIAKMTSEQAPKGSVTQTLIDDVPALLAHTQFSDVCGIGFRLGARLARLGVFTPLQITFLDDQLLSHSFGPFWSKELRKIGLGEEPHFLAQFGAREKVKSVGRSLTTREFITNQSKIEAILFNLMSECIDKIRTLKTVGHEMTIFLAGNNQFWQQHLSTKSPLHQLIPAQAFLKKILLNWTNHFPVLRFGIRIAGLSGSHTPPLLKEYWKQETVQQALDALNSKYGIFTIKSGALMPMASLIKPEVTGFLGDKIYQMSI